MRRRGLRAVLWAALGSALAATAALAGVFLAMPKDRVIVGLHNQVTQTFGMELSVEGMPEVVLFPVPGLQIGRVTAIRANGPGEAVLSARNAVLRPSLRALTRGDWVPGSVTLLDVDLRVTDGWQGYGFSRDFRKVRIRLAEEGTLSVVAEGPTGHRGLDLDVTIADAAAALSGRPVSVEAAIGLGGDTAEFKGYFGLDPERAIPVMEGELAVRAPLGLTALFAGLGVPLPGLGQEIVAAEGQFRVKTRPAALAVRGRADGELRGHAVSADVVLAAGAGWEAGAGRDVSLILRGGGLFSGYLDGRWTGAEGLSGGMTLSALDLPDSLAWLGIETAGWPVPPGVARASGRLSITADGVALDDGAIDAGGRVLNGSGSLAWTGERPLVSAQLQMARLELPPSTPDELSRMFDAAAGALGDDVAVELVLEGDEVVLGSHAAGPGTVAIGLGKGPTVAGLTVESLLGGTLAASVTRLPDALWVEAEGRDLDLGGVSGQPLAGPMLLGVEMSVPSPSRLWTAGEGTLDLSIFGGVLALPDLPRVELDDGQLSPQTRFSALEMVASGRAGRWALDILRVSGADWEYSGAGTLSEGAPLEIVLTPVRLPREAGRRLTLKGDPGELSIVVDQTTLIDLPAVAAASARRVTPDTERPDAGQPGSGELVREPAADAPRSAPSPAQTIATDAGVEPTENSATPADASPGLPPIPVPAPR